MNRLEILFVTPYAPNPIRVRPYNLIRSLARRGHHVTLATLWSDAGERGDLARLTAEGVRVLAVRLSLTRSMWNCLASLPRPTPLQSAYCWQPQLLEMLNAEFSMRESSKGSAPLSKFDVVHVEHLRGARYAARLKERIANNDLHIPVVWDSVDCISHLFEQSAQSSSTPFGRVMTRLELPRTRWYEAWLVGQVDRVLVTSEQDRRALYDLVQEFAPPFDGAGAAAEKLSVLPNGVDLDLFAPTEARRAPQSIVMTGKMSYHANVTAAIYLVQEVMPFVWEKCPFAQVQIVGQNPPRQVTQLARRNPERVSVTGTVTDLRPYLARATLAIAPIRYGAGIQNKVLEAMAMGTPVVATSKAVAALAAQNEQEVLIGDSPEALGEQILRLIRNPSLRERLAQAGRHYVEMNHDWNRIAERLETSYLDLIGERRFAV